MLSPNTRIVGVCAYAGTAATQRTRRTNIRFTDRSMMQTQTALEARNLTKTVSSPEGPLTILSDVSLTVRSGETLAVVGASGAGKSAPLALLAGLDSPSSGEVLIAGVE